MKLNCMQSGLAISSFIAAQSIATLSAWAIPSGSYQQSCENWAFDGTILSAECWPMDGRINPTELDISGCVGDIANVDGGLSCFKGNALDAPGGSYYESCRNIVEGRQYVTDTTGVTREIRSGISAECRTVNGYWNYTYFETADSCPPNLGNDNGVLVVVEYPLCAQR